MWEVRKLKLYSKDARSGLQSDSLGYNRGQDGEFRNGRHGKRGKWSHFIDVMYMYIPITVLISMCVAPPIVVGVRSMAMVL